MDTRQCILDLLLNIGYIGRRPEGPLRTTLEWLELKFVEYVLSQLTLLHDRSRAHKKNMGLSEQPALMWIKKCQTRQR